METLIIYTLIGVVIFLSARSVYRTFKGDKSPCDCENSACSKYGDCISTQDSEDCEEGKMRDIKLIQFRVKIGNN